MEYSEQGFLNRGTSVLDPKTGGPKTFHFINLVKFRIFNFDAIRKIQNTEYGKKTCFEFHERPKFGKFCLSQGLIYKTLKFVVTSEKGKRDQPDYGE